MRYTSDIAALTLAVDLAHSAVALPEVLKQAKTKPDDAESQFRRHQHELDEKRGREIQEYQKKAAEAELKIYGRPKQRTW